MTCYGGAAWNFQPCTSWMPAIGVTELRCVLKNLNVATSSGGNDFTSAVAVQVATVDTLSTETDAGVQDVGVVGTSHTGEGEWVETIDLSATVSGKYFIRIGFVCKNQSVGNVVTSGTVSLTATIPSCGRVVGSISQRLYTNTEDTRYIALAPWQAAWGLEGLVAALIQNQQEGGASSGDSFESRFAYQTAIFSQDEPAEWTTLSGSSWLAGAQRVCTTEFSLTSIVDPGEGDKPMWFRPGLAIRAVSGATWGEANVAITVAVRT